VLADPAGVRRRIGYLGQGNSAGHHQRVHDEIVSQGRAYGLTRNDARRRAGELLATLDLADLRTRVVSTLSGGQRRRLDVAIALVHRPALLFLDEPSTGLDPQNRANLWDHILDVRRQDGTTVFLTTHYLDEADTIADRVVIIDDGQVIADGTPARLKADLAGDRLTITVAEADADRAAQVAERATAAREIAVTAGTVSLWAAGGNAVLPEYLRALDDAGVKVRTADVMRPTLDDVFLTLTGRTLREGDQGAGLFGPANAGYTLLMEMQTGAHERLLVTPMNRSAMLVGRALKEIAPLLAQSALIIGVTVPFGFSLHVGGALAGLVVLSVLGVGLAALSYALAIAVRKQDWMFWAVQQTLLFPLVILSGMLLPLDMGPAWMQAAGRLNPLTAIVGAERALFSGNVVSASVLEGAVAAVMVAVTGLALGTRAMRRSTA
jgi:ABC-2 type transport system ATP-binding protein